MSELLATTLNYDVLSNILVESVADEMSCHDLCQSMNVDKSEKIALMVKKKQ